MVLLSDLPSANPRMISSICDFVALSCRPRTPRLVAEHEGVAGPSTLSLARPASHSVLALVAVGAVRPRARAPLGAKEILEDIDPRVAAVGAGTVVEGESSATENAARSGGLRSWTGALAAGRTLCSGGGLCRGRPRRRRPPACSALATSPRCMEYRSGDSTHSGTSSTK